MAVVFDDFFDVGLEDHLSPFLTPKSRRWGINLSLRASILSAIFLFTAYFAPQNFSSLLLLYVYVFAGVPSLINSIEDLLRLEINISVLMTLAAFSSVLIGSPLEGGLLLVLFSLSEAMEDAVTSKAKGAISSLYKLSPTTANVLTPEGTKKLSVQDVSVGDKILIKAGSVVPLDGVVTKGSSSLNLVHLTGESLPVTKAVGDTVPAGGQNLDGSLTVEVTHTSGDSTIARIIDLVTEAQGAKPKLQQWFSRVSKRYATTIIGLTFFFALVLPLFGVPFLGDEGSIYRSVAFLIAASPCALIIATPIAYLSAISACARKGILLKGGVTLDALAGCSAIAFDKTGTLTTGNLRCTSIEPLNGGDPDEALAIATALEENAVHPIATAVAAMNATPAEIKAFKSVPGKGLKGKYRDQDVFFGKPPLPPEETDEVIALLEVGDKKFHFHFQDTLRPGMPELLKTLKKVFKGQLLMLTGDHQKSAAKIAVKLSLDTFYADLSPQDKLRHVSEIALKEGLAMVGDGVNDAPALARSTVGISMGQVGSYTAIEAADIVLLHDDLELLPWLMLKAKKTRRIVAQNLVLASSVILLATTPALLGYIPLWLAVVLHEGGTVLVGLNALRLIK